MPAQITYQPHLLDPHRADPQPVQPRDGRSFRLAELYEILDCRTVDVVRLTNDLILIIDDESKLRSPAYLNLLATYLWYHCPPPGASIASWAGPFSATTSNSNNLTGQRGLAANGPHFFLPFTLLPHA